MADEAKDGDRTPGNPESDLAAVDGILSTPQSDPGIEAARKQVASAADKKFQAAARMVKEANETVAQFKAKQADEIDAIRRQAYQDYVNAGWRPPEEDAEAEPETEPEPDGKGKSPKAAEPETVNIPKKVLAELQGQLKNVTERLDAGEKAAVKKQEQEFYRDFYACIRKYPDAFPDPDTQDPDVVSAIDRDARRAFAYWLRPDQNGLSDFDRGIPLETKVKQVAKENVAARKAIDSRKKPTAPHPSQRGDATHEGPGGSSAIPEKLQKMDIDDKDFDKEVAKHLGSVGVE